MGPYGDWVKYSLEEPAVLVTECDGVSQPSFFQRTRHECAACKHQHVLQAHRPSQECEGVKFPSFCTQGMAVLHANICAPVVLHMKGSFQGSEH